MESKGKEAYLERFTAFLKGKKYFRTPERLLILDEVLRMKGHFTAEDLQGRLNEGKTRVSTATVYNTLPLLVESGILHGEVFTGHKTTYELAGEPHHHLVCRNCGAVKAIKDLNLDHLIKARRFSGFTAEGIRIQVYGLCSKCKRAMRAKNKQT